jgi:serine/threonine-protein kinase
MTQTPEPPVKEGDVVAGRYVIDHVIAVGGMGTVVAARHVQLGHKVALKFLHTEGHAAKEAAPRFLGEAKAAARLKGEHVVHVSDMGTLDNGVPYMVMEYLDGVDLGQALEREGAMAVPMAVECVLQACEGLAEAHAARIVHRDLKPQNLFRTNRPDGTTLVKVLDFGVSKALSDDVRTAGTVTSTDAVFGSPLYMSPEQMVSATRADQRSDLWSIGVVLYELLTARLPFEAETMTGLCVQIANSPPRRLRDDAPHIPAELEAVIERCLEKDPQHRYQNVAELAADLAPFAPAHAQSHVESIRRLVGSGPPASLPSLSRVTSASPSGRRLVRPEAETLGPMTGADLFAQRKSSRVWVLAAAGGVGLLVVVVAVGAWTLRGSTNTTEAATNGTTPVSSAIGVAPPPSVVSTGSVPANASSVAVVTPTAATSSAPKATNVAVAVHTTVKPPPSAPPSASIITGISHDRK